MVAIELLGNLLTWQLRYALAALWQHRFFHDQNRKAILDLEAERAALADEPFAFQEKLRPAGIEWTAEDIEQVFV